MSQLGAMMSATDPVATIAVLNEVRMAQRTSVQMSKLVLTCGLGRGPLVTARAYSSPCQNLEKRVVDRAYVHLRPPTVDLTHAN